MGRKLPRPDRCLFFASQDPNIPPTTQCDRSIICQRCGFCFAHCVCASSVDPKPETRRGGADPQQMTLCDRPNLRFQEGDPRHAGE
jgi:hypothetical protein